MLNVNYTQSLASICREEAGEHVLRELDDVDGPGLRGLDAGHLRLLPAPQLGAIEQVALGTAVQERLKYSDVKKSNHSKQ